MKGHCVVYFHPNDLLKFISYFDDLSNNEAGDFSTQIIYTYHLFSTILVTIS